MSGLLRRTISFMMSGAFATGAAFMLLVTPAIGGIANTKHNLSSGSTQTNHVTGTQAAGTGTDEICVFCHTPHAADTSANAPPLWNKSLASLPQAGSYQTYSVTNSSTIDGDVAAVGSISIACLSCHDGTQAMDNIINAPGSGGYNATGGGAGGLGYTWTGNVSGTGAMTNGATTLAMLGTDLRNDHPIGIQYCGGGYTTAAAAGTCADGDFNAPSSGVISGTRVFWVDTAVGTGGTREKTDMILFNRTFPVAATTGPAVECASCHDPHVESGTGNSGQTFLRISNSGSNVCLACHNK